ncbi:hypothetical protein B0T13DRAFT_113386 [Neurospora crassa]|nr:hypothetical protein B0T13DRAFT_113386 [Neurospora crassa]
MQQPSSNELSPIGAFLMRILWLLYASAAHSLQLLDATLWPAWKASVMWLDHYTIGTIISIVDAVTGTHSLSTITPFGMLARLAASLLYKIIDWFPEVPSFPEQRCGSNYRSWSTQTTTDDPNNSAMLEFFGSGLDYLTEFFATDLKSVASPFDGNTPKSSTSSLVAVPRTPVRQQSSLANKTKSTSPSFYGSDDDAA